MNANEDVEIYAKGFVHLSVCAPKSMQREVVEARVNAKHPTGLDHGWKVSENPFRDGTPNPGPCNDDPDRQHWLLVC
jgi:hypothetical protein